MSGVYYTEELGKRINNLVEHLIVDAVTNSIDGSWKWLCSEIEKLGWADVVFCIRYQRFIQNEIILHKEVASFDVTYDDREYIFKVYIYPDYLIGAKGVN